LQEPGWNWNHDLEGEVSGNCKEQCSKLYEQVSTESSSSLRKRRLRVVWFVLVWIATWIYFNLFNFTSLVVACEDIEERKRMFTP
jgi:hypothetical protein